MLENVHDECIISNPAWFRPQMSYPFLRKNLNSPPTRWPNFQILAAHWLRSWISCILAHCQWKSQISIVTRLLRREVMDPAKRLVPPHFRFQPKQPNPRLRLHPRRRCSQHGEIHRQRNWNRSSQLGHLREIYLQNPISGTRSRNKMLLRPGRGNQLRLEEITRHNR